MNVRQLIVCLCAVMLLSMDAAASIDETPSFPVRIEIENFGIYRLIEKKEKGFQAETTAGYASVINTRHIKETDRVVLKEGEVFGFNYVITDTSTDEEWVPVLIQIKHPVTNDYMGKRSQGFSQNSGARLKADGRYHNGAYYIFSESYEMVPGEWHISVIYRDEMVVSKRFLVE